MTSKNYIAVAKQLEDNTILLSFPDFEGLTAIADSEDNIQTVAVKAIKTKLAELKNSNIEAPEPKKIIEVSKNLQTGEFTTYVLVTEVPSLNALKDNETLKSVSDKVDNFINSDIKKSLPEGKEHFLAKSAKRAENPCPSRKYLASTAIYRLYTFCCQFARGFFRISDKKLFCIKALFRPVLLSRFSTVKVKLFHENLSQLHKLQG